MIQIFNFVQLTENNYFPTLKVCEMSLALESYFSYCGIPRHDLLTLNKNNSNVYCHTPFPYEERNISSAKDRFWGNGIFNVTLCR